jgi:hypothetical protein
MGEPAQHTADGEERQPGLELLAAGGAPGSRHLGQSQVACGHHITRWCSDHLPAGLSKQKEFMSIILAYCIQFIM